VLLPAVWYVQFPISGRFSEDQRAVYEGVLNAQRAVLQVMVPGTSWPECHRVATREVIKALLKVGVCFLYVQPTTCFVW
jgi:Xaa-Pro aminopeptidase